MGLRLYITKRITRHRIRRFVRSMASSPFRSHDVLDVGAGYRSNFRELGGWPYHTLDSNKDLKPTYVADAMNMKAVPNEYYGTVICTEVLEHLWCPEAAVRECKRVLRPGGLLILTVPFWYPIHEKDYQFDYFRFTPRSMRWLLNRCGFNILSCEQSNRGIRPTGIFAAALKPQKGV